MSLRPVKIAPLLLLLAACQGPSCPAVSQANLRQCEAKCASGNAETCWDIARFHARPGRDPNLEAAFVVLQRGCAAVHDQHHPMCVAAEAIGSETPSIDEVASRCEQHQSNPICAALLSRLAQPHTVAVKRALPPEVRQQAQLPMSTVNLEPGGALTLDGQPTDLAAIRARDWGDEARVMIRARGPHATRDRMIEVIEALQAAGVTRYALNADPELVGEP